MLTLRSRAKVVGSLRIDQSVRLSCISVVLHLLFFRRHQKFALFKFHTLSRIRGNSCLCVVLTSPGPALGVHLMQELLLGAEHTARAAEARPSYKLGWLKIEVFHGVAADHRPCPAKAGLAMNCECWLPFCDDEEVFDQVLRGAASVCEEKVVVFHPVPFESLFIIGFIIESGHGSDALGFEYWCEVFRGLDSITI